MDENDGPLNKHIITKEYYTRIKKIWNTELLFAVPVLITSVDIIDWTINNIKEIDCKTRKQWAITGKFHPNGDVDRLYILRRYEGDR